MADADVLFELSWEVCNKVGGIYTVMMSKAALMQEYYENYIAIGPYFKRKASLSFQPKEVPENLQPTFSFLQKQGITCHYGAWQIKGEPTAILIEHSLNNAHDLRRWFWDHFNIDSLNSNIEFDEPMLWSWACALLLEALAEGPFKGKKIVSHHHEWMAGFSLLYTKANTVPIKTVFTTHATILGRSIASSQDLYSVLDHIDPVQKAYEVGVQDKFLTEKACAQTADVFTTVSEITALEAEKILGRKPDVLVLNGLDMGRFPTIEETSIKHVTNKEHILEFLSYYFFPYYRNLNLNNHLIYCIFGRYEFTNKGIDVFIDALGKLNKKLQEEQSNKNITAFIWIPNATYGVKQEILENKNYYRHIKSYVEWHGKDILRKIINDFITCDDPSTQSIYTKEFMQDMKKEILHFKREGNPPLVTHNIPNEQNDAIVSRTLQNALDNKEDDPVKVVIYPCYLDGADSLLNTPYYEALSAAQLAVFPSYYEPWGYTPLESSAMGVPTITTDVAGFGRFIKPQLPKENPGIYVVERFEKNYEEVVQQVFELLYKYSNFSKEERVQNKVNAKQLSKLADWRILIQNYIEAHNLALKR